MRRHKIPIALFGVAVTSFLLWSCQTTPPLGTSSTPKTGPLTSYVNRHDIQIRFPRQWHLQDATVAYPDLRAAEAQGASYLQLYSYDPLTALAPGAPVPPTELKIAIVIERNVQDRAYPDLLADMGDRLVEKSSFTISGRPAIKAHYRIDSEETGGSIDILSVIYLDQELLVRFICYPWNSKLEGEFETVVMSFRYKGR